MKTSMLALAAGLLMAAPVWAAECCPEAGCTAVETHGSATCCAHCGKHCGCEKYCQVVPYVKEVKKTVWVVKCEDYCPSLPGCPFDGCKDPGDGCNACQEQACETCDSNGGKLGCGCAGDVCAIELAKKQTPPKCAPVHTRQVLTKKEVTCKVPSYKCVVVYGCQSCGSSGQGTPGSVEPKTAPAPAPAKPEQQLPPPPKVTALPMQPEAARIGMAGF